MSPGGREMAPSGGEWEDTGPGLLTLTIFKHYLKFCDFKTTLHSASKYLDILA